MSLRELVAELVQQELRSFRQELEASRQGLSTLARESVQAAVPTAVVTQSRDILSREIELLFKHNPDVRHVVAKATDRALDEVLGAELTEPAAARATVAALPDGAHLVTSSSMPVRDVEWYAAPRAGVAVHANRGANGIDGVVSTAVGVALAAGAPTGLLIGDVAMYREVEAAWHSRAARALLTRWDLSKELLEAACGFEQPSEARSPTLGDVLCAARQLMDLHEADELTRTAVLSGPLFGRLGFDVAAASELLAASTAEVDCLKAALSD